jgi:mono/diheme cytochrome c family protein
LSRRNSARLPWSIVIVLVLALAFGVRGSATAQGPKAPAGQQAPPSSEGRGHQHGGQQQGDHKHDEHPHEEESPHIHAPVPEEYRIAHVPSAAWTNQALIARGKEIYDRRCSVCHGEQGDGKGPAAAGLPLKPPSFRDARMVNEMAGNYWFWRISEGGLVEPFKSMGSVMPAWKNELSLEDLWAVIAYTHTLSGHAGPHVTSEHPEMLIAGHAQQGAPPSKPNSDGAAMQPSGTPAHKH